MASAEPVFFKDRAAWRAWLDKYHDKRSEIWVLAYKRNSGTKCMSYVEALEGALCYGWIDSRMRRIDDEKHMWRFAPRKPNSIWSLSNRKRAEQLIREGRMAAAGLAKINAARKTGEWQRAYIASKPPRMPKELKEALMEDALAWKNFRKFAKSYRTMYIRWVLDARTESTRNKRIREVVRRARINRKPFV